MRLGSMAMSRRSLAAKHAIVVALLIVLTGAGGTATAAGLSPGHVYTMTNDPAGNAVVVFNRAADGTLTKFGTFPTGGTSIGVFATGNQNGLLLDEDSRCLWAVNSLDNEITAFRVMDDSLSFINKVGSGGRRPISLTEHKDLLYVLNAGGQVGSTDNITGFTVDHGCGLSPLAGSTRSLSAPSTSPAQVGFTPSGRVLVVTEKVTNKITTYTVGEDGRPSGPMPQASAGPEPFGFTFINRGQLFVTEAACSVPRPPGNLPTCVVPPDQPALSSYEVADDGTLTLIDTSVDNQAAKCWVVATNSQRFAYTVNALAVQAGGLGSITGYRIDPDGDLTKLGSTPIPAAPLGVPIDAALSNDSRFLYVLHEADGIISAYRVEADGGLVPLTPPSFAITAPPPLLTNGPFPNGLAVR